MTASSRIRIKMRGRPVLCFDTMDAIDHACANEFQMFRWFPNKTESCVEKCSKDMFDIADWSAWTMQNWWIPLTTISAYTAFIVVCSGRTAFDLSKCLLLWNACLTAFSVAGAFVCVPSYVSMLVEFGWKRSLCIPASTYSCGGTGLYITLFIYSKIIELGDTVFIVLRGRRVSFLHAYHHVTVLLFCWHSFAIGIGGAGLLYAAVNYTIHALMYGYYALMMIPAGRSILKGTGIYITTLQIAQMIVGIGASVTVLYTVVTGQPCFVSWINSSMALVMYASYAYLFIAFYRNTYVAKSKTP